jgi:hypothetical protein
LQHRIGEQSGIDILGVFGALVLKLRLPAQLAEHGKIIQYPAQLGVRRHMALHIEDGVARFRPAREQDGIDLPGTLPQNRGVLPHGNSVHIHHTV